MAVPGWKLHPLVDGPSGHWALWVNGNWRMTFMFKGSDAELVDDPNPTRSSTMNMHNPPHPGEILREWLEGVTVTDAAAKL